MEKIMCKHLTGEDFKVFFLCLASATPPQLFTCVSSIKVSLKGKSWGSDTQKLLTLSDIGLRQETEIR